MIRSFCETKGLGFVLLALLVVLSVPASASATTFGANLSREPNSSITCVGAQVVVSASTCSASSIDLTTGESNFPPAGEGIVTKVRVRVGAVTGPMQIVEEEALRAENPSDPGHPTYACCKEVAASAVFTPSAEAITTVPVNFHVKQDLAPEASGYYVDQHLSLSVLSPSVPIPASADPNASVGLWFPAWQAVGEERAGIFGTSGAMVLFDADWEPAGGNDGGGAGGGAGGAGGEQQAPLTVLSPTIQVRGGDALIELLCNLSTQCRGRLRLQSRQSAGLLALLAHGGRTLTYAGASFKIRAGGKATVKAALKSAGKRLLSHRGSARAWLNVGLNGATATVPPARVTLRK